MSLSWTEASLHTNLSSVFLGWSVRSHLLPLVYHWAKGEKGGVSRLEVVLGRLVEAEDYDFPQRLLVLHVILQH